MTEIRREGERRAKFKTDFALARKIVWSWLTDPAVLLYRREAHGRKRARVTTVEFFLFIREVTREFYDIEGTSRAASLAYTTLLSLIPLLVAFTQVLQRYFRNLFPNFQAQIDNILNNVIPYQSPVISYHIARFAENAQAASTFGVIIFIVIAFRLFLAVEATINQIWKVRSVRGYRPEDHRLHDALLLGSGADGDLLHHHEHAGEEPLPARAVQAGHHFHASRRSWCSSSPSRCSSGWCRRRACASAPRPSARS